STLCCLVVLLAILVHFFFSMIIPPPIYSLFPYTTLFRSKMRKFDLSLRSSRSSYFATFRHQLTILSKTDALDEEKWLNMLGTFVKDWFRYESHFVHGRDSLVDILKERGLLSESDAVQPLIRVRNIRALNGRFNTSITHAYSIVIGSKHITLNATGGGFLTASKQFRHGATSKS